MESRRFRKTNDKLNIHSYERASGYKYGRPRPTANWFSGGKTAPTVLANGGNVLVAAADANVREGTPPSNRVTTIEFPSRAAADAWYTSSEYAAFKHLRHEATSAARLVFLDRFEPPAGPSKGLIANAINCFRSMLRDASRTLRLVRSRVTGNPSIEISRWASMSESPTIRQTDCKLWRL